VSRDFLTVCQKTQEASVLRQVMKRIAVVTVMAGVLMSGGMAYAKTCTSFGCTPTQGNPVQELGGMIVSAGIVAVVLFGFARRYVK
jgi:hypothetical protein